VNPQDAWNNAYHQLELQLDRPTFDTWVRDAALLRHEAGVYVIGVRNSYARDMLEHRLYRGIRRVLSDVVGQPVELRFEVYNPPKQTADGDGEMPLFRLLAQQENAAHASYTNNAGDTTPLHKHVARPQRPDIPDCELNPRYTFDRFIVGTENQMIYAAAQSVLESPAASYNPFFVYGDVGVGKTHLMQAIAHACVARGLRAIYIPSEAFTNDLIDSIRSKTTAMFREKYRSVDVLIVDDIQFISGKETTQEEFFHTFNALYTFNKQVILASDRHPRELETLEARLRSRFEGGLVMDMQPPSLETRMAILRMWARERGIKLDPRVTELVAARGTMNVRELEGVFNQMVASSQWARQPLTPPAAEELLESYHRPRNHVSMTRVLDITARHHGLTIDDLVGPRRDGHINQARQIAMYLAREMTNASLPQIGDAFGGRKHSTVLHGCNKVAEDLQQDLVTRAIVEEIRQRIIKGD